ncbi:isoprenylcysteine carboxyl methyltransferase [Thauera phenylacetica B4P]|uniref:Isoprenylcysteine carboxyl methyltransferase n=4 Tax=Betaproteobacteria TaxID=28216 RepID=N7A4C6_9RHOO|nr:isoprenylcysteine carboxyl methyltransferase [Thauera phenylacetica B4P]
MYLGMFISLFGVACVLGSTSALAGPVAFFALAQFWYIRSEEEAMTLKFGDKYIEYQRSVPRWL